MHVWLLEKSTTKTTKLWEDLNLIQMNLGKIGGFGTDKLLKQNKVILFFQFLVPACLHIPFSLLRG